MMIISLAFGAIATMLALGCFVTRRGRGHVPETVVDVNQQQARAQPHQEQRIIVDPFGREIKAITTETTLGNPIENEQPQEISPFERNQFRDYAVYAAAIPRGEPDPIYNCHGLAFASKRTAVDAGEIPKILSDDSYIEIPEMSALPGDVIIYYGEDGDAEHSGVLLTSPSEETLKVPRIVSKWGKYREFMHFANNCPYSFDRAKYFRVRR